MINRCRGKQHCSVLQCGAKFVGMLDLRSQQTVAFGLSRNQYGYLCNPTIHVHYWTAAQMTDLITAQSFLREDDSIGANALDTLFNPGAMKS
jgi:hypothetical protein